MTAPENHFWKQYRLNFLLLAPILIVLALLVFLPPDGNERVEWMQFIGRFHPLTVHFPVALVLLVPVLELTGRIARFSHLRLSVDFVLELATLGAIAAATLGWCLGRSGGYSGSLVTQHMWGGILLALACWLCWVLRTRMSGHGVTYACVLATAVGLVAWTGYRGGQLSLGADHLTEHMPAELRHALGLPGSHTAAAPPADPNTFFGARVQPILAARCTNCHGPDKRKANLRVDLYRELMRGGKDGPAIQPGNPQASELFRRITLPVAHDDFMPKGGKSPLSSDQVKTIELWIAAGASDTLPVRAIKDAPVPTTAASEIAFTNVDPATVANLRSSIAPAVAMLQKQFPNILDYESRDSADLRLNASPLGTRFTDNDLTAFAPVAEHITVADLSRTAITDRSSPVIAEMKRLRVLRLGNTAITDATLQRLGGLTHLESLNVFGTHVTSASLAAISGLPKLARLYAGQTAIPPNFSAPASLTGKLVF